jgi:hypothetical protein
LKKIAEDQPNLLLEVYEEPTYDEVKVMLENYLAGADPTATDSRTSTSKDVSDNTKDATQPAQSVADVSEAFDKLFKKK